MRLQKIKLSNFRSFGSEQTINIDDMTVFIGNNSAGKTAALAALNCMFSENPADRVLKRSDFNLPKDMKPEELEHQDLYVEAVFVFNELAVGDKSGKYTIPPFFESMVVAGPNETPYLRIRMEATWDRSSSIDGAIDSKIYFITCPEAEDINDDNRTLANRKTLDLIRVLYIPAVRDPSKQLRNASGTMMYQIMNCINWSEDTKNNIRKKIEDLNSAFMEESGVSILSDSIHSQWKTYDSDERYSNAKLRFNSTDIDTSIKKSEVVFLPTETGKEYSIDQMGDGLRSLFYISLVDSILDVEVKIKTSSGVSFNRLPTALNIIALEEPENHISPHLMGKLIENLKNIAEKCNAQIVLTSHSPAIVKRIDPKCIRHFRLDSVEGTTKVRGITLPDEEKLSDQYKYIKEAVKAYPELYFAKLVILGEGDSEEIILPKFWEATHEKVDISGISIVPLGGRHVNHFWRLLNDLNIPHITLLDLDKERAGGCWGRIHYALNQLIDFGHDRNYVLQIGDHTLSDDDLDNMANWEINDQPKIQLYLDSLAKHHVYFSAPLDVDFLMLEHYGEIYKKIVGPNEGPRYKELDGNKSKGRNKLFSIAETEPETEQFRSKVDTGVRAALKEDGGDGITYTSKQKRLMVWYSYFFLQRGKPSTHIEAMSRISDDELISKMPKVFADIFDDAKKMLGVKV